MPKALQLAWIVPGTLLVVLLFAMFPAVLHSDPMDGVLHVDWKNGFSSIRDYVEGFGNGQAFRYLSGSNELSFWSQIGDSFSITLFYMAVGALAGITIGVLLGVYFAVSRAAWLKRILELTSVLPDFVIVLLLQFLIVYLATETGFVFFKVASPTMDDPAIALPLLSTVIIPANYMIRNVALHMNLTLTEDYISFAKARGLGKTYIIFFHAVPNVLPYLKADLHKFMGILFGNLFIFEYLYNLNGVTLLVFSNAFAFGNYQYNLVVNGILTLFVLYAIIFALLRFFIYGWEKVVVR
ncbi:ABC transporter permease subunit [Paenibacillus glycinis]|uniref:ABC transporter permease subunit n=1 Tax=Paenibacillus glycinis TaxID=2697035 RepID=A0ABW9XKM5_9BACL|nr:ABC transporter permease subunit [Paenibacillus glycinis]NBD23150.1 ABC transporter permease subunit [Paenibacillus glycinis]